MEASAGRHASHSFQNFFLSVRPNKRHTDVCQRYVFQPDKYWTLKINYHENDLQFNALRSWTREVHVTRQHGRLLFCFIDAFSVPRVMFTLSYRLGQPWFRGSTPGSTKRLFASLRPPNQFSSQFASYSVGTRGSNAWGEKMDGAWRWPLTSTAAPPINAYSYSSICPYVLLMRCFVKNGTFDITFFRKPIRSWEVPGSILGPKIVRSEFWAWFACPSRQIPGYWNRSSQDHYPTPSNLRRIRLMAKCNC
jgi:hypothetical protein